jgi:hypothetical protein
VIVDQPDHCGRDRLIEIGIAERRAMQVEPRRDGSGPAAIITCRN